MPSKRRESPRKPTRYQAFVSLIRQYDQDELLKGLSTASCGWDGSIRDDRGKIRGYLPWDVLGSAAVVICRGTSGKKRPTPEDIAWICHVFSNIEHPGQGSEEYALQLIGRILYQQWHLRKPAEQTWARTVAIYSQTDFREDFTPKVMIDDWDQELFGCSINDFASVGFILYSGTNQGSYYPFRWEPELAGLLEDLGGADRFHEIVSQNFLTDKEVIKSRRKAYLDGLKLTQGQQFLREPFAFNPLISRPLVGGIEPDRFIAPSVTAIALKCSAAGVIHAGLEKWSTAFTDEAGLLFEVYVGRHLSLLEDAEVLPEIVYRAGKEEKKSVDWIVILPEAVLLVECKNSMPTAVIKEGRDGFIEAHAARVGKGIEQINTTVDQILNRKPEFLSVPADRPFIGFVVTLEPFELANIVELREKLPEAKVPVSIVGSDFLEFFVTLSNDAIGDLVDRISHFTTERNALQHMEWVEGVEGRMNPILEKAFDSIPVIAFVKGLEASKGEDGSS